MAPKRKAENSYQKYQRTLKKTKKNFSPGVMGVKKWGGVPAKQAQRAALGAESKFFDSSLTGTAIGFDTGCAGGELDPATILCLNGVPLGDTDSSRDGSIISQSYLHIQGTLRFVAQSDQTSGDTLPSVFLAVVLDKSTSGGSLTQGAQLNSEDVYTNPSGSATTLSNPFRRLQNITRFDVLKKRTFRCPMINMSYDGTNIEQQGVDVPFEFHIPLKGMQTRFYSSNTSGYVTGIQDNSLHLIGFSTSSTVSVQINYNARLRYIG